jgi:hypothetical protein
VTVHVNQSFETTLRGHVGRRRKRTMVLSLALGVAFIASTTAWLSTSGLSSTNISPPAGSSASGLIATINGASLNAQLVLSGHTIAGVPVTRAVVADSNVNNTTTHKNVRFSVAWTNAVSSTLNGSDIVAVGLAYPIALSSGTCATGYYVKDTDVTGGQTGVCVVIDTSATGRNVDTTSDSQQGMMIITRSNPGGSLIPGYSGPANVTDCTTISTVWCQPPGIGDHTATNTLNRTYYLIAQVVNNGGHVPPGQQPSPGNFVFFVNAKAIG